MPRQVALSRPKPGTVQVGTRLDQPGDVFDLRSLRSNGSGPDGWCQAWIQTRAGNILHALEHSGVIALIDFYASERHGAPFASWVSASRINVKRPWSYRGETSAETTAVESVTACAHSCWTPEGAAMLATQGRSDRVQADLNRRMTRLFGRDWRGVALEGMRARMAVRPLVI